MKSYLKNFFCWYSSNTVPYSLLSVSCTGVMRKTVVVIGDGGCGKTSLLLMLSRYEFPEDSPPTEFKTYTAKAMFDGTIFEFKFVDTGGEILGRLAGLCVHVVSKIRLY